MKNDIFGSIVASTVAGLFVGGSAMAQATKTPAAPPAHGAAKAATHHCLNSCKGKSACKSAEGAKAKHSCHGQNACKEQGWLDAKDAAECKTKGGIWKA